MKRVVIVLIVIAVAGAGAWWWHGRSGGSNVTTAKTPPGSNATGVASTTNPPSLDSVSADHENKEIDSMNAIAKELALSDAETNAVLAALHDLQQGRRSLFDDLSAKRIDTEQVSKGLHELRSHMRDQIVSALGTDRAELVLQRIRDEHR